MAPTLPKDNTRNRQRTIKLSLQFGENILAETNAFEMHLTDEKTLPDYEGSKPLVLKQKKRKEGWIFT
jgi:peptidyl-dipeptidase Dcp